MNSIDVVAKNSAVIPEAAKQLSGIHDPSSFDSMGVMDSGLRPSAGPGMTTESYGC
jgi:hypothetical protein